MLRTSFLLLLFILLLNLLSADISVYLTTEKAGKTLHTTKFNSLSYYDMDELNAVLGSVSKHELSDHRVHLTLCGEQFIFMQESSYYSFKTQIFNMYYPMLHSSDKFYLPEQFLTELLPRHLPSNISFKANVLNVTRAKNGSILRIVLDPGHGGKDPGAVGKNGTLEKNVNLGIVLKLKKMLEKELGMTVLLTRSEDVFVSLTNRTQFANNNKADLFVSVHTNASKSRAAEGLETYYLSTALNSDARAVEALENDVVELYEGSSEKQKYDDLAFILSDLSQTEHLENSNNLAFYVQKNVVAGTKTDDRGVKQANFYVLRGAFMPAILIECGFISNLREESLLASSAYQEKLARTIFEGIKRFKYRYDRSRSV